MKKAIQSSPEIKVKQVQGPQEHKEEPTAEIFKKKSSKPEITLGSHKSDQEILNRKKPA